MNKFTSTTGHPIKSALALGVLVAFTSSCANQVVVMEAPVEQLKDLQDHDSDGVIEAREQCADTVLGAVIDNNGCPTKTATIEPLNVDIKFANNSFVVDSSAYREIEVLATYLQKYPEAQAVIEGHTSRVGSAELNKPLSDNRAAAVVGILVNDFSISAQRLSAVGYGFERLKITGDTEQAHSANRRIAAELSQRSEVDVMKWTIYTVDQTE